MAVLPTFAYSDQQLEKEILQLNQRLLNSIVNGDWAVYKELCANDITCFEPETGGHQVEGMPFHKFFFPENALTDGDREVTMASPKIRILSKDRTSVLISYVRVNQRCKDNAQLSYFPETRIWSLIDGKWKHVHFHKSKY
ncbi:hypothetical protein HK103_004762 [Boothiomyces macroporosus]|uniref:Calcium/calmodulin-dependent protein kinase II association-domain domain-containing protein n=1 Tax=Boothiomyces macroporosus TaxID=261099 RepID=A0AAD5Y6S8_9FUNG|nr:hypothetical protein HK103_004762 [Boothiomyces macroporosus]